MKPKTLILMGVAITCGLGASYMTSRLLAERSGDETEKVVVLVAKKNMSMGDPIKEPEEMFESKEFLRGQEPRNAIDDVTALKGRILKRSLRGGDFVTNEDLFGEKDAMGLQVSLPPGYRGIGIRVNMESIAGGFASLPLSRVDIISTIRRGDDKSSYSQIILEDVLVVAADTQTTRDENGRAMPANVVTVALKPEDVLKLTLAKEMGPLSLVLRKMGDGTKSDVARMTAETLKAGETKEDSAEIEVAKEGPKAPPPAPAAEPKPAPAPTPAPAPEPVVADVRPQGKQHVLVIREGERTKRTEYLLDDANEVIVPEVSRTELTPPRPGQAEAAPPRTPAAGPQAPAVPAVPADAEIE